MEKKSQSLFFHLNYLSQIPKFAFQEESDKASQHKINRSNINFIENQSQANCVKLALKNREQHLSQERTMKSPQIMTNTFVFNNSNINIQNNFYNELQPTNNQKVHLVFPMSSQNTPSRPSTQDAGISQVFRRIKKAQLNQGQRSKSSLSKIYNSNTFQNNINLNSYTNPQDSANSDQYKLQNLLPNKVSPTSISASYRSVSFDYTGTKFQNRQKIGGDNPKRQFQTIDQGSVQFKQPKQDQQNQQNQFRSINIQDYSSKDNESFAQYENYLNDSFFDKKKQSTQIQNKSMLQYQYNNNNSHQHSLFQARLPSSQQQSRNNSVAKRKYSSKSVSSNHNELAKVYGFNQKATNINKPNIIPKQGQQLDTLKARPPSTNQSRRSPLMRQRKYKQNNSIMCESPDYQNRNKIQIEQIPTVLSQNQNQFTPNEKNLIFSFNCELNPNRSFQEVLKDQLKTKNFKEENSNIEQSNNSKFYFSSLDNIDEQKDQSGFKQLFVGQKNSQNLDYKNISKELNHKQNEQQELSKTIYQDQNNMHNSEQDKTIQGINQGKQNYQHNFQKQNTKKIYEILKNTKSNSNQLTNDEKVEDLINIQIVSNNNQKNTNNSQNYKTLDSFLSQNVEENVDQITNIKQISNQNQQHFKRKYNTLNKKTINLEEEKQKILQMIKSQNQNIYQNQNQINKTDIDSKNRIYLEFNKNNKNQSQIENKRKIENKNQQQQNIYINQQESVNKNISVLPNNQINRTQIKKINKQKQYDLIGAESSYQDKQSISPKNNRDQIIQPQSQNYNIESQRNLVEDSVDKIDNNDRFKSNKIEDQIYVYYDKYLQDSNGFQKIFKGKKCENDQESSQTRFSLANIQVATESQKELQINIQKQIQRQSSAQNKNQAILDNKVRSSQRSQSVFQCNDSNRDIAIEFGFSNFHSIENSQALSANNSKENSPIPTPSLFEIQKRWAAANNKNNDQQNKKQVYEQKVFINNSQNNLDNYIPNLEQQQSIKKTIRVEDFESSLDSNSISVERKMQLQMRNIRDSYSSLENQSDQLSQYTAIFQKVDNQNNKFVVNNHLQQQTQNSKKYNFYNEKNENQIIQFLEEPLETFGDVNKTPSCSNKQQI
ncbi:hypothetical protein TTHERM_00713110 (macronuclear) [Tetrahymena thermophila SB210]|uniref:Uncharacterized protein n=1 Tax=Tetrahymena thermophila (strain SB210) TaxID=312017 RepID=Q24CZ0_TETTS|nr:hypothetical protein TTHERM_00713110 [Tetrahymena thermophila SB210]EAS05618.1 hypothetical protein TTHERM_00713110 [Tetrahymena thermophila SB210]|eukprot:XP_001025863.1 hypothetical protein TTHERM_00713110 [Tetrahymena thermophila SB210]